MKRNITVAVPLVLGIFSIHAFVLYFYSANHAPSYKYVDIIFLGPLFTFIGVIFSVITRKSRKIYPALWMTGLVSCMFGFIICVLVFIALISLMAAK